MWLKYNISQILSNLITQDMTSIKEMIKKYSIISFDIFDTLLKRRVAIPTDIFNLVENAYNQRYKCHITNFKNMRIHAEQIARAQSYTEDTTILSIYQHVAYDTEIRNKLMALELEIERQELFVNEEVKALFEYAHFYNKKIIIVSDMYLPKDFIASILFEHGYGDYYRLFVSSDVGVMKTTGNMFRYVLKDMNCRRKEIIHIGDALRADWLMPTLLGIRAFHISSSHHK